MRAAFRKAVAPACVVLALCLSGLPVPAAAMNFAQIDMPGGQAMLEATGPILPGDFQRLLSYVDTLEKVRHLAGLVVNSPGGVVTEAEKMAGTVHDIGLPVAVASRSRCASACVLIFTAAPRRAVAQDARIGVHRASFAGAESGLSRDATDGMVLECESFGMPRAVVDKMRATPPGGITWLTPADLAAMHVAVYQPPAEGVGPWQEAGVDVSHRAATP